MEIIEKILCLSQNGARKTEILYNANLSYQLLQEYIYLMLKKRLLEERMVKNNGLKEIKIYYTTINGNELMININNVYKIFNKEY